MPICVFVDVNHRLIVALFFAMLVSMELVSSGVVTRDVLHCESIVVVLSLIKDDALINAFNAKQSSILSVYNTHPTGCPDDQILPWRVAVAHVSHIVERKLFMCCIFVMKIREWWSSFVLLLLYTGYFPIKPHDVDQLQCRHLRSIVLFRGASRVQTIYVMMNLVVHRDKLRLSFGTSWSKLFLPYCWAKWVRTFSPSWLTKQPVKIV